MFKKIAIGALALIAIFLYVFISREPSIKNFPSENSGVVAFGDSLVQGVGSERGGGFVRILSEELGVSIENLGRSGDTTADALLRVDQVVEMKPAVTIILLGGNDFLRQVPERETEENLEKIIEKIEGGGSAVLLIGIESKLSINDHDELFERLVKKYQTAYVSDILDGIFGATQYMSDSLHPNDKGYEIMANKIKPVLAKILD